MIERQRRLQRSKYQSDLQRKRDAARNVQNGIKLYDLVMHDAPDIKQATAAKRCGVSIRTLRDWLKQRKAAMVEPLPVFGGFSA